MSRDTVKVYFCRLPRGVRDASDLPPCKATAEHIAGIGGSIIPETEEEVEKQDLSSDGRYDPAIGDKADDKLQSVRVAVKPPDNLI